MALRHLLLLKFKDDIAPEKIEEHFRELESLKESIKDILSFQRINNIKKGKFAHDFKYGFEMEFKDEQGLQNYIDHPHHKEISNKLIQDLERLPEGLLVCDFYI